MLKSKPFLRWLSAPVLLLPLSLLLAGALYSLSHLSSATTWQRHTDEVRVAIGHLRSTVLAGETAMRGFLVAGEADFLEPYHEALANWRADFERVRRLTTDNPVQQQNLSRLDQRIRERFGLLAQQLAAYKDGRRDVELTASMRQGKAVMATVRSIMDAMEQHEIGLDSQRQEAAIRRWQVTTTLFVVGAFGSLLLLGTVLMQRRAADARRYRAEEVTHAIDRERHLLQAILAGIEDGITLQDRQGKLVFANAAAARVIGFPSPEALLAAPPAELMRRFQLFDEEGAPLPPERLPARVVLSGQASEATLTVRYRPSGAAEPAAGGALAPGIIDRWSRVRAYPVLDQGGQLIQAINVFQDVTAEHREDERQKFLVRATDQLGSSLDYQKTLSAVAQLAVPTLADWCAVDLVEDQKIQRVAIAHIDPAKIALVAELERRYPSDPAAPTGVPEIIRTGIPVFLPDIPRAMLVAAAVDDAHLALIDALELGSFISLPLKTGGKVIGAITFAMAESKRHHSPADVAFAESLADRAALAIENARLFSQVEQGREALARQLVAEMRRRQEAEDASRFAETFVGILGHDLRNPLNAIAMTARLLQKKGGVDERAVDRIVTSTGRMSNMVGQLLDLTRSRLAGGITVDRKPIHLGVVINEVLDELRRAYPVRDIQFEPRGADDALADLDRFAQVVSNLVGNAIEHGDAAEPVTVALAAKGEHLVMIVHNAGQPIAPELLPNIFDPFRRTTVRGALARGLGLGLFISQQIVLAHGGTIAVTSSVAQGTTFTVTLPRLEAQKIAPDQGNLIA